MQAIARVWRMGQRADVRAVVITSPLNEHEARLQKIQYSKLVMTSKVLGARAESDEHACRLVEGRELFDEEQQKKTEEKAERRKRRLEAIAEADAEVEGEASEGRHVAVVAEKSAKKRRRKTLPSSNVEVDDM